MKNKIPTGWRSVKLGDILKIRRGASPRPIHEYIKSHGMPWLKIADVTGSNSRFVRSTKEFIKEEGVLKSVTVRSGDLILSNSATPGIPRFMKITACVHDGWLVLEEKDGSIDKNYLYYKLLIDRKKLVSNVTGAVFDNLKTDVLREHQILLPPIEDQKKIASILSAFDDKIELNNKISKTLENMAQAIYKEWFEKNNQGEIKSLFDIAEVTYGHPFKSSFFNDFKRGTPLIRIRNLEESITSTYTTEKVGEENEAKNGDILVGMDGEFYIRKWSGDKAYINQRIARIRPKKNTSWFHLFLSLKEPIKNYQTSVAITTVAHLSDKNFKSIKVKIPSGEKYKDVALQLDKMYWLIIKLAEENQKLIQIRDFLLPKLMKGEIKV